MSIKMQVGKPYLQTEIEPKRINGNVSRRIQLSQDYNDLTNKPSINEIELVGDLTLEDLGIPSIGDLSAFVPKESSISFMGTMRTEKILNEAGGLTMTADYQARETRITQSHAQIKLDAGTIIADQYVENAYFKFTDSGIETNAQLQLKDPIAGTNSIRFAVNDADSDIYIEMNRSGSGKAFITGLTAPFADDHAANKKYVDDGLAGKQAAGNYAAAAAGDATKTAVKTAAIPYAQVDDTSTSTVFTATVAGITEYKHGTCCMLKNGIVTSASGFTVNVNGLGAKPVYNSMAAATADTTLFNINYTMLFIYDETRVTGGCWVMYRGYNSDTNTIGYQIRTNSSTMPAADKTYRYRLLFTSADGQSLVPANTSTSTNATAVRTPNTRAFDPFGPILYYNYTTAINAGANFGTSYLLEQMTLALGYSFNSTGVALDMPFPKPIYIKATPQADGSAVLDATEPYVFALPTTEDGKIYIYLGRTYSATNIEMMLQHPVYYYKNGSIRLWTGPV